MQPLSLYLAQVRKGLINEVNLSMRNLTDDYMSDIIAVLRQATNVKVLDLEGNSFTSRGLYQLCDYLDINTSIREVNFNDNKACAIGAERVLNLLANNHAITAFSLLRNDIPEEILKQIDYAGYINTQPTALKKILSSKSNAASGRSSIGNADMLPTGPVTNLDLSNTAGKLSLQLLAQAVKDNEDVESLSLANCALGDPGLELVGTIIFDRKNLSYLDLSSNGIGRYGIQLFSELLKKNTSIRTIVLKNNKVADDAARHLVEALKYNDSVQTINLLGNAVTERQTAIINRWLELNRQPLQIKRGMQALENNDPRVEVIEFQWVKGIERAGEFLGPPLKNATFIKILNLSNAGLKDQGVRDLCVGLKHNKSLERLELANNMIGDDGGLDVIAAIKLHPTMKEINLANNLFGNPVGRAIVDMLELNDHFIAINVEINKIDDGIMTDIEGLTEINKQPLGIKRILRNIERDDPALNKIDFSVYDGHRYLTCDSAKILSIALIPNTNVKYLDLSNNSIGDIGAQHLSEYVLHTNCLEVLKLNDIGLSDRGAIAIIDALRANEITRVIELEHNPITDCTGKEILSMLMNNTTLIEIHLGKTRISEGILDEIYVSARINMEPLKLKIALHNMRRKDKRACHHIDLSTDSGAIAKSTDETVRIFCRDAIGHPDINSIDFSNNEIGIESIRNIAQLLSNHANRLNYLNLSNNPRIDDQCAQELANGIMQNYSLRELDISETGITSDGVLMIADSLKKNNTLKAVQIDRDKISSVAIAVLSRELALNTQIFSLKTVLPRIQSNDPSLTALALQGDDAIPFNDLSCQLLCLALQRNTTIEALDLSNNNITSAGVEYVVDMLLDNKTLRSINLSGNRIDDAGGKSIVKCLESNDSIINIDIANNKISDEILKEIDYMLSINSGPLSLKAVMVAIATNDERVTEVDFNGLHEGSRPFDDESVHVLCALLVANTHVKAIDLANNQITDVGASLFADLLRVNSTLEALYLENNQIKRNGAEALFQTLKANHTLTILTLDGNRIPSNVLENLSSVINVNKQPLREYKPRTKRDIMQVDDYTQFRDHDYMRETNDEILEHALVNSPQRAKPTSLLMREMKK